MFSKSEYFAAITRKRDRRRADAVKEIMLALEGSSDDEKKRILATVTLLVSGRDAECRTLLQSFIDQFKLGVTS